MMKLAIVAWLAGGLVLSATAGAAIHAGYLLAGLLTIAGGLLLIGGTGAFIRQVETDVADLAAVKVYTAREVSEMVRVAVADQKGMFQDPDEALDAVLAYVRAQLMGDIDPGEDGRG